MEPLLTSQEAAEVLDIPVEAVGRLTESGKLHAIKLGGSRRSRTRIGPDDLREYQRCDQTDSAP